MNIRFFALLIFLIAFGKESFAQETITLEDVIAIALDKNFDIRIVRYGADSAGVNNRFAFGAFLPQINAGGQLSKSRANTKNLTFNDTVPAIIHKGVEQVNTNAQIALNWTIFDGTRMFATRQRVAQLTELSIIRVQNQMMNSVAAVSNNYFNIIRQKQQLKAVNELMLVSDERVKLAEKKLQVGTGGKPELLQAKVDLNTQRVALVQQQQLIQQLKDQLNGLLGLALPPAFETSDTIPINLGMTEEMIIRDFENTNQAMLLAHKNMEIARTQLWESRALRSPIISVNSAYQYNTSQSNLQISPASQKYTRQQTLNGNVAITIPILNNLGTTRSIEISKIRLDRATLAYEQQRANALVAIRVAYTGYDNAKKVLAIEEENIQVAKENVYIALETFKRGINTYIELRTAQQTLSDVYNQLIAARYNAKVAEIELLRLKGALLTDAPVSAN